MISFVIVNYKTGLLAIEAVKSIFEFCDPKMIAEIIVVDNSEQEEELLFLKESLAPLNSVLVLESPNKGFGAANNVGVSASTGDILFLLNSDASLTTPLLPEFLGLLSGQVGVLAPKVLYPDGRIQENISSFVRLHTSVLRFLRMGQLVRSNKILANIFKKISFFIPSLRYYFEKDKKSQESREVEWASGCALIIRKDVFTQAGGFDENIFLYYEDEELCYRIKTLGYKTWYAPQIIVQHDVGGSNKEKNNEFIEITKINSELYYYKKHFPQKLNKLRTIYKYTTTILSPFSKRMRIINKAFQTSKITQQ